MVRNRLYKHLEKTYKELQEQNIQQLHFHLPNNDSFLRFHKPSKFGDNLSKVRSTIAYTNMHKVNTHGFEEGKIFNGYRYVYPLFDINYASGDKVHIGSVEVSHSVNSLKKTYEQAFKKISLYIVIDKNIVNAKVFKDEKIHYEESIVNSDFLHEKKMFLTNNIKHASESIKIDPTVKTRMSKYKNFSIAIDHRRHKGIVSFVAIQNPITKKDVAYAISFQQSDYLAYFYEEKNKETIYLVFVAFLMTLVLYFVLRFNKELNRKVYMDVLMNIYNRRFFEAYLEESCKKQKRANSPLSLIMFDIDYFKNINDTHGHDVGDEALRILAKVVKEHTRKTDVFARWGGEEFMLLVDINLDNAYRVAENLRISIQKYTRDYNKIPEFTCSFGVIDLAQIETLDEALKKVDSKLYEAKKSGRNKVLV